MMMPHTSFCNKETRARIENLQPSELLMDKNGTHNVKIYADYFTKHRQNGGHQRKKGNAGVFKPTSAIRNFQSKVLGKSSYVI